MAFMFRHFDKPWLPVALVWSCLVLEPVGHSVEVPLGIMALAGMVLFRRQGRELAWKGSGRLFTGAFLLLWVPMLVSLPLAIRPGLTALNCFIFLRYYFAGLFVLATLGDVRRQRLLLQLSSWVLLFWIGDALLQAVRGVDLFGYAYPPERLNGIFGRHIHLGIYLAVLSPLLLVHAQRSWRTWGRLLAFCGTLVVVLLAGSRAGWIILAVVFAAYFLYLLTENRRLALRFATGLALVLVVGTGLSYRFVPGFDARVAKSLLVFKGNEKAINTAISGRIPIWTVSLKMFAAHPWTGVGVRGYRYAYPRYAAPGDPVINHKTGIGAFHPHQLLLEVACEMGVVGLAGLLGFFVLLFDTWRRAGPEARRRMLPYGLALLGALFPLNTHLALFSSAWAQVIFWLVALYLTGALDQTAPLADSDDGDCRDGNPSLLRGMQPPGGRVQEADGNIPAATPIRES